MTPINFDFWLLARHSSQLKNLDGVEMPRPALENTTGGQEEFALGLSGHEGGAIVRRLPQGG
jgi:hypothetical protein